MGLTGPSKTIRVEPLRSPTPKETPAPAEKPVAPVAPEKAPA